MEVRRKSLSDVPTEASLFLPSILERSPLLDRRALRSYSASSFSASTPRSKQVSVFQLQTTSKPNGRSASQGGSNLRTIAESPISRSRSDRFSYGAVSSSPRVSDHPEFRSSPSYRVNPVVVRFDERLLPERMNYGIGGYNTSRPVKRVGVALRPRTATRSVHFFRVWTRRLRVRLIRFRVRSACSRIMRSFRRRR